MFIGSHYFKYGDICAICDLTLRVLDRPPSSTVDLIMMVFFETLTFIESGLAMNTSGTLNLTHHLELLDHAS